MVNFPNSDPPTNRDAHPRCRNCGAIASAKFCPECGQSVKDRNRSIWSFAGDFLSNLLATDSRAIRTLALLVFRPGVLTQENLRGRWQRYVPPFRLYLFLSLLSLFALLGPFSDFNQLESDLISQTTNGDVRSGVSTSDETEDEIDPAITELKGIAEQGALDEAAKTVDPPKAASDGEADDGFFAKVEQALEEQNEHFKTLSPEEQITTFMREVAAAFPTFLIMLIPLFALGMKILYLGSGRYLFEHLIFSSHFNSLALLVFAIGYLLPSGWPALALYFGYLPLYLALAMRRVYGSSWIGILLRLPIIFLQLFFISLLLVLAVAIYAFFQA
jgi:hypothetical protein